MGKIAGAGEQRKIGLRSRARLNANKYRQYSNVWRSNRTIIKGVLKSFLMVYEEALLGNDLEGGGRK
jgi:hypothetical protein